MKGRNSLLETQSAAAPPGRRALTIASLFAAVAAAFVGAFLFVTFSNLWDAFARSDELSSSFLMIPVGSLFLTLFGFWIALPLTLPPALVLGHLSPFIEPTLSRAELRWVQYGGGAGIGFSEMLALGFLVNGDEEIVTASISGLLAGLVAVRTYRRFCYG